MAKPRSLISKGRGFQTRILELIKETFNLGPDDIRTAIGAETGADIKLTNEATREKVGLAIECKNVKSISTWAALEQAKAHAKGTNLIPTLIFHRSQIGNRDIWITVPIEHYLELRKPK